MTLVVLQRRVLGGVSEAERVTRQTEDKASGRGGVRMHDRRPHVDVFEASLFVCVCVCVCVCVRVSVCIYISAGKQNKLKKKKLN